MQQLVNLLRIYLWAEDGATKAKLHNIQAESLQVLVEQMPTISEPSQENMQFSLA